MQEEGRARIEEKEKEREVGDKISTAVWRKGR